MSAKWESPDHKIGIRLLLKKETVLYIHARYTRPHFTDAVVLEDFKVQSKEPTEISQHGIAG